MCFCAVAKAKGCYSCKWTIFFFFSPTHTHPDHRASFIIFLHLQRSMASSLFNLRAWQSCVWCESKQPSCLPYPGSIIPSSSFCPMSDMRWRTCWVNYEALLIAIGVIGGILLIFLIITICCCYRRCSQRCNARRERREEQLSNAEFQERRARNDARRAERQVKYDDIRRKYGLATDDGASASTPYTRFDNET